MVTERELVAEYRERHPWSRIVSIIRYARNTSATRQMECVLCGEQGPSWCGRWPKTQTAWRWEDGHKTQHTT